ncbi:Protein of unknown function [Bacillus wiedmannii]|nr:Protein of unknown function [Bacillus wiedmannii]
MKEDCYCDAEEDERWL